MTNRLLAYTHFFWAGISKRGQTGAIVPSQRFLVEKMIQPVPVDYRGVALELGAGTGALTVRLAARCPETRVVACELNPTLARNTRRMLVREGLSDRVEVLNEPAERVLDTFTRHKLERPGFVISGIPLGNLDREKVCALVEGVWQVLPAGGAYIQFQHSLLDRKKIIRRFPNMRTTPVWLNFPPAVVYCAVKD